jgi:hypothetical protein
VVESLSFSRYYQAKYELMNYDEIDVDKIVNEVSVAVAQRNYRKATKKESMKVRLAALALYAIETDLTANEIAMIDEGMAEYRENPSSFVPFKSLQ